MPDGAGPDTGLYSEVVRIRLNRRPARSTPVTAPLSSRVKKPRSPVNAPLVMMYSSASPGSRPRSNGAWSGGRSLSAAARISGFIRTSSLSPVPFVTISARRQMSVRIVVRTLAGHANGTGQVGLGRRSPVFVPGEVEDERRVDLRFARAVRAVDAGRPPRAVPAGPHHTF